VPHSDHSDHIHASFYNNDSEQFEPITGPDWDELERAVSGMEPEEPMLSWADASCAIALLVGWMCGSDTHANKQPLLTAGIRVHLIQYWLDPTNSRYSSIEALADEAGLTRQAVSKILAGLRAQLFGNIAAEGKWKL